MVTPIRKRVGSGRTPSRKIHIPHLAVRKHTTQAVSFGQERARFDLTGLVICYSGSMRVTAGRISISSKSWRITVLTELASGGG